MLQQKDFQRAANFIGCDEAIIRAVNDIESAGGGFLPDGRVKILFEGHRFWKQLVIIGKVDPNKALAATDAQLKPYGITRSNVQSCLYKVWTKTKYRKNPAEEWDRMSWAIAVCKYLGVYTGLALNSASYGAFQILGENHVACGYSSAHEMHFDYSKGEANQLDSFVMFVKSKRLDDELRRADYAGFAAGYNGTGYRQNKYDTKLQSRHLHWIKKLKSA